MRLPFSLSLRSGARLAGASILLLAMALALHWRPSRQVRLHQEHFVKAVENRNWKEVGRFVSPDYRDRWGETKAVLLRRLPQIFGNFLVLGITQENPSMNWENSQGVVSARIRLTGSGGPIAQLAMQHLETFAQPFQFQWQAQSWRPWDWALVEIDQPEITMPEDPEW